MGRGPPLVSIRIGRARQLGDSGPAGSFDKPWRSGIFKTPVDGPIFVGSTNLAGDFQEDLVNHGGPDKAICAYSSDHYDEWRAALGVSPFDYGAFGENFTVRRLTEADVCIGDTWSVADVQIQ